VKKGFKRKSLLGTSQDEPGVASLIDKMQQQLNAVEKKLDILIGQSSKRPFEKSFSQKPFRRFDHSSRHDRGSHGSGPRERTYTQAVCAECNKECEIPFKPSGDRPVYCKECFSKRKRGNSFNASRNNRFEERNFSSQRRPDKRQTGKRQKSARNKKKPFFQWQKKRT